MKMLKFFFLLCFVNCFVKGDLLDSYSVPLPLQSPLQEYGTPLLEPSKCLDGIGGPDCGDTRTVIEQPSQELDLPQCQPITSVITNTQFVPTTVYSTKIQALPTTIFREITQTQFVSTTVVRQEVVTSVEAPVIQTKTEVVTNTAFITRADYFTETNYVTNTKIQYATETQYVTRTKSVTHTTTNYQVRTQFQQQIETQYQTKVSTTVQFQHVTQTKNVPHYITKIQTTSYPVFHTVTNTQFQNNLITVTSTHQAIHTKPVYQTFTLTQLRDNYVTVTKTIQRYTAPAQQQQGFTTHYYTTKYVSFTVQAPCGVTRLYTKPYYGY